MMIRHQGLSNQGNKRKINPWHSGDGTSRQAKGGFTDEIIFSSRVSASLLDVDDEDEESPLGEEE